MGPIELLCETIKKLESLSIDYLTTGSMASTIYGEPRYTNDIDIVIHVQPESVEILCRNFPDEVYYVSIEAAREAAIHHTQFNVIHPESGLKIDFMIASMDAFDHSRFERAQCIELMPGVLVRYASPEDVILRKLQYYKEGKSEKHVRDIRGILQLCYQPIDKKYIHDWAVQLGVLSEWMRVNNA